MPLPVRAAFYSLMLIDVRLSEFLELPGTTTHSELHVRRTSVGTAPIMAWLTGTFSLLDLYREEAI